MQLPVTAPVSFLVLALGLSLPLYADERPEQPEVYGWVEWVDLGPERIRKKAKLDTGALTSSLDAREIEEFRRDGRRYVRFELHDRDSGKVDIVERPIRRFVRIVRHSGNHQRRPVIEMGLCLGDRRHPVEFTLIDRSNFNYPVLLGRRAMDGYAIVDPARTFRHDPDCR